MDPLVLCNHSLLPPPYPRPRFKHDSVTAGTAISVLRFQSLGKVYQAQLFLLQSRKVPKTWKDYHLVLCHCPPLLSPLMLHTTSSFTAPSKCFQADPFAHHSAWTQHAAPRNLRSLLHYSPTTIYVQNVVQRPRQDGKAGRREGEVNMDGLIDRQID